MFNVDQLGYCDFWEQGKSELDISGHLKVHIFSSGLLPAI